MATPNREISTIQSRPQQDAGGTNERRLAFAGTIAETAFFLMLAADLVRQGNTFDGILVVLLDLAINGPILTNAILHPGNRRAPQSHTD